jgi:hypothetical protein
MYNSHSNFKETYNILYVKVLQNTIYCGTLLQTRYYVYGKTEPCFSSAGANGLPQSIIRREVK